MPQPLIYLLLRVLRLAGIGVLLVWIVVDVPLIVAVWRAFNASRHDRGAR